MKKLFNSINIKGTIVIGVITTVICVYFVQPLIDISRGFTGSIFTSLVNYYYVCSATVEGNEVTRYAALLIFTIAMGLLIVWLFDNILKFTIAIREQKQHPTEDFKTETTNIISEEPLDSIVTNIERIERNILRIEEQFNNIDEKRIYSTKALKRKRMLNIFGLLIYIIFLLNILVFAHFPYITKSKFNVNITKITPYVETKEIEMLKSDWVRMKTKDDYIKIVEKIDFIVSENNLD